MVFTGSRLGNDPIEVADALHQTAAAYIVRGKPAIVITGRNAALPVPKRPNEVPDLRPVHADDDFDTLTSMQWNSQFNCATSELLIHNPNGDVFIDSDLVVSQQWLDAADASGNDGVVLIIATNSPTLDDAVAAGTAIWTRSTWTRHDVEPANTLTVLWEGDHRARQAAIPHPSAMNGVDHQDDDAELHVELARARPFLVRDYGAHAVVKILHSNHLIEQFRDSPDDLNRVLFASLAVHYAAAEPEASIHTVFEQCWQNWRR